MYDINETVARLLGKWQPPDTDSIVAKPLLFATGLLHHKSN